MSDTNDFRARATEIFRQLRSGGDSATPSDDESGAPAEAPPARSEPDQTSVETAEEAGEAGSDALLAPQIEPLPEVAAPTVPPSETSDASLPATSSPVPELAGAPPPNVDILTPGAEQGANPESLADADADQAEDLLRRVLAIAPDPVAPPSPEASARSVDDLYGRTRSRADSPGPLAEQAPPAAAEAEQPPGAPPPGRPQLVIPASTLRLNPLGDINLSADDPPAWTPGSKHPGSAHSLPRILAIANQKGGVGKTTTAVNLGAALAELHYRVLVVDLDPQGNATTGLGINGRNLDSSVYDVILHETPIEDVIEPTTLRNLFVVPATIDLAGAEIELVPVFSRELRLRKALDSVRDDFDFMLIDCPPSLGLLTVNGLAAATEVVVPIQCEYYALEGLSQLLRNVNLVQGNLNAGLELSTIILTMYDARTRLAEQVVGEVRSHFGARVCRNVVPRTVRLSEAPSFGQPIIVFDSSSRGAIAYRELAKEVSGGAPQRVR